MPALSTRAGAWLCGALVVGLAGADPSSAQPTATVRVDALVDGRSQLVLRGATAQWFHLDYAAPGREQFVNVPTVINGVEWFPVWPDIPDAENRNCGCHSSVFTEVDPPLPLTPFTPSLRVIQGRHLTSIVQLPNAGNDFTLIIEFDDNPPSGSDHYIAEIDFSPQHPLASFTAEALLRLPSVSPPGGTVGPQNEIEVHASFTLAAGSDGIDPVAEGLELQVGSYTATIPAGLFRRGPSDRFDFNGVIAGVRLRLAVIPLSGPPGRAFRLDGTALGANLSGTVLPVKVGLVCGNDHGETLLTAAELSGRSQP